jgi:hypothetical protein
MCTIQNSLLRESRPRLKPDDLTKNNRDCWGKATTSGAHKRTDHDPSPGDLRALSDRAKQDDLVNSRELGMAKKGFGEMIINDFWERVDRATKLNKLASRKGLGDHQIEQLPLPPVALANTPILGKQTINLLSTPRLHAMTLAQSRQAPTH